MERAPVLRNAVFREARHKLAANFRANKSFPDGRINFQCIPTCSDRNALKNDKLRGDCWGKKANNNYRFWRLKFVKNVSQTEVVACHYIQQQVI